MNRKQGILVGTTVVIVIILLGAAYMSAVTRNKAESNRIKVVATFYPLAYFAREIGGDKVSVSTLVPANTDIHSWQPSTSDIVKADDADIIIYNGGPADHWFEDSMLGSINKNNKHIVDSTKGVNFLRMEANGHEETNDTGEETSIDPHTWISPVTARIQAENIYKAFVEIDPENTDYYTANWHDLDERFKSMDRNYSMGLANATIHSVIVTHAAFGYIGYQYNFSQYGVIGLSADEQPSTSTISNLVDLMKEKGIYYVYVDPVYTTDYAESLKAELEKQTGKHVTILRMYLMLGEIDGMDYFQQMAKNLENLEKGLGA